VRHLGSAGLLAIAMGASALSLTVSAWSRDAMPTVTIVEGPSTIHAVAGGGFLPSSGVRLHTCDILRTGSTSMVQFEYPDGGRMVIGGDTRFVFDLPKGDDAAVGPHFLLSGWPKITVPKRDKGPSYRVDTPFADVLTDAGIVVVHVGGQGVEFFVEQGEAAALTAAPAPSRTAVGTGRMFERKAGERGAVSQGIKKTFVQDMPGPFRDTLPTRLSLLTLANVQPRPSPDYKPGEANEWLRSVPDLHVCLADVTVRSAQLALERGGIEVGPIDGILGPLTQAALRKFQQQRSLPRTGRLDTETLKALDVPEGR